MTQIEDIRAAIEVLGADETRATIALAERGWNERVARGATAGIEARRYVEAWILNAAHAKREAAAVCGE